MADLKVLLSILLDKAAQKDVERGLDAIDKNLDDVERGSKSAAKGFRELSAAQKEAQAAGFTLFSREQQQANVAAVKKAEAARLAISAERPPIYSQTNLNPWALEEADRVREKNIAKQARILEEAKRTLGRSYDVDLPASLKSAKDVTEQHKQSAEEIKREQEEVRQLNKEIAAMAEFAGQSEAAIEVLPDHVYEMGKAAMQSKKRFEAVRSEVRRLSQLSAGLSRIGAIGVGVGAGIFGAYIASAKNYIDFIEDAGIKNDQVANRWLAATKRVENAQLNLGAAAAQALLPYLEKAADLIERVSQAVQQNPEAVKQVLGIGAAASVFGAITLAVAKGIRIYADVKFIAATVAFDNSVNKFLAGASFAGRPSIGAGGVTGGLGGIGKTLGTVTLLASSVVIGAELGAALGNALGKLAYGESYKKQGLNDAFLTAVRLAATPAALLADSLEKMGGKAGELGDKYGDFITKYDQMLQGLLGVNKATEDTSDSLRDFSAEAEAAARATEQAENAMRAIQVVQDLTRANAEADRKYAADRSAIYRSSGASIRAAGRRLKDSLTKIDQDLETNLAKLATDYAKQSLKDEQNFQEQRQKTIQEANERVQEIRKDAQEKLLQLEQDHADRLYDLGIARDALGIIQENRRYDREKAEIHRQTQEQIAESRRQAKVKLAEQRREFLEQQQERRAEYLARVAEEKAQAEQRRKEAEAEHAQQIREIGRQTTERLSELRRSYNEQKRQRIIAAQEQLRDLGVVLNQERLIRMQYYQAMLGDTRSFMTAFQSTLSALSRATTTGNVQTQTTNGSYLTYTYPEFPTYTYKQMGGYGPGFVERGDEFILNPATTRAAESLIGNRLSQASVLGALQGRITWNDQRRFDAGLKPEERRLINDDTLAIIESVVGGA